MRHANRQTGFTLVELLLVVLIIGLLASILVPNLVEALQKAKQKRTMVDMRGLGTAWLSWMTDQLGAASAGAAKTFDRSDHSPLTYTQLEAFLRPTDTFFYAQEIPQFDGWDGEYQYTMRFSAGYSSVLVCSGASGRTFEQCSKNEIDVGAFIATEYFQDIVWADGFFVRWPKGTRGN